MRYLPISLDLNDKYVLFAGGETDASAKVRLVAKTNAKIIVIAPHINADLQYQQQSGRITWVASQITSEHIIPYLENCTIFYAATGDKKLDAQLADLAHPYAKLINAVDQQTKSDFITPAMVNHTPLTIAISTEGAAPVLARFIKAQIESLIPKQISALAELAGSLRPNIDQYLKDSTEKRHFWQWFFKQNIHDKQKKSPISAEKLIHDFQKSEQEKTQGGLYFLPLENIADKNALTHLRYADDIYYHDNHTCRDLIEMARREANFFPDRLPSLFDIHHGKKQQKAILIIAPYQQLPQLLQLSEQAKLPLIYLGKNTEFTLSFETETQLELLSWANLQNSNHMVQLNLPRALFPALQAKLLQTHYDTPIYLLNGHYIQKSRLKDLHHAPKNAHGILLDYVTQHEEIELAHAQNS